MVRLISSLYIRPTRRLRVATRKEFPMLLDNLNTPRHTTPDLPPWLVKDLGLDGLDYWSVRLYFGTDNGPQYSGPRYFGSWPNRAAAEVFYVRASNYLGLAPEVWA